MTLEPDRAEAERFLKALDPTQDAHFCFQTFDDDPKRKKERAGANKLRKKQGKPLLKDPLARWRYGTLAEHFDELAKLNARGAGIYVTVNKTDGKGRKKSNIMRVRASFVDLDGAPIEPVNSAGIKPHIVVESSPNRFHAYWCYIGRMPLRVFEPLQRGLAARFNGDPAVHDLPRVMRLPGFLHKKAEPFLSRIVAINGVDLHRASILLKTFRPAKQKKKESLAGTHGKKTASGNGAASQDDDELRKKWKKLNGEHRWHQGFRRSRYRRFAWRQPARRSILSNNTCTRISTRQCAGWRKNSASIRKTTCRSRRRTQRLTPRLRAWPRSQSSSTSASAKTQPKN
jgi:hypothetical protein